MRILTTRFGRTLALGVVAPILLGACSSSAATPVPSASATAPAATLAAATPAPSVTPTPPATASPEAVSSPAASGSGGPVDYAAWVERQGFGGSSGLREVAKETRWMHDNPTAVTPFDIQSTQRLVDHLITWLEQNAPTACWADYHATVQATLGRIHAGYVTAHDTRASGSAVPDDVVASLVKDADAAAALPDPAGC
jgi:hypothetical protein